MLSSFTATAVQEQPLFYQKVLRILRIVCYVKYELLMAYAEADRLVTNREINLRVRSVHNGLRFYRTLQ